MKQAADQDVADCLKEILNNNASAIEDLNEVERKSKPVIFDEKTDYYTDRKLAKQVESSTPGISTLFAFFAWIVWIGGVITALVIASQQMNNGFFWFFVFFLIYLFSGSLCMAVSCIIRYLSRIADSIDQMKKQSQ